MNIKRITKISIMVALMAIGAFIKIPMPFIGYLTFQLTFAILAGILLGKIDGSIATIIYAFGGLIGIPWFTEGGGIYYIFKPSFGFILMFIVAAFVSGYFREYSEKKKDKLSFTIITFGNILATILVWVFGMLYVSFIYQHVIGTDFPYLKALASIFSLTFAKDILFAFICSIIGIRVYKQIK